MSHVYLALIAVFAPLAAAVVLMLVPALRRAGRPAAWISLAGAGASLYASITLLLRWRALPERVVSSEVEWLHEGYTTMATIGVSLDGISVPMLAVVALVAVCVQIFSLEYMASEDDASFGRYFTWHSLFLFSMQGLVIAPNMLQLFACWELVGLCSYLLIGFYYRKPSAARAALKAFWVTKFADMGLLLGLILQYVSVGSFGWDPETVTAMAEVSWVLPAVAGLYFLAVMGKSAQFPLHIWLPDAMEGPTPVSALLHAATMVAAGVFLIVRAYPIFLGAPSVLLVMALVGGITAFLAACIAVVQTDIKKVLAYSTCSQLGYMIAGLGAGSLMAGYFHLTTHAFFKALLFLAAGSVIHAVHSNELVDMGGLWRKMKVTSLTFILGAAALAGLPLLSGFFSKDLILESIHHATSQSAVYWVPLVACTAAVGLTAFYMGRVVVIAFFGKVSDKASHAHESGPAVLLPLVLLAGLAVVAGFGGTELAALYGVDHYEMHYVPPPIGIVATLLAAAGLILAYVVHVRGGAQGLVRAFEPFGDLIRMGPVDRFWAALYRRGMVAASMSIGWFDRYVIDGLMNVVGVVSIDAAQRIRQMQTGRAHDYVMAVLLGLLVLAAASQIWSSVV